MTDPLADIDFGTATSRGLIEALQAGGAERLDEALLALDRAELVEATIGRPPAEGLFEHVDAAELRDLLSVAITAAFADHVVRSR